MRSLKLYRRMKSLSAFEPGPDPLTTRFSSILAESPSQAPKAHQRHVAGCCLVVASGPARTTFSGVVLEPCSQRVDARSRSALVAATRPLSLEHDLVVERPYLSNITASKGMGLEDFGPNCLPQDWLDAV